MKYKKMFTSSSIYLTFAMWLGGGEVTGGGGGGGGDVTVTE